MEGVDYLNYVFLFELFKTYVILLVKPISKNPMFWNKFKKKIPSNIIIKLINGKKNKLS